MIKRRNFNKFIIASALLPFSLRSTPSAVETERDYKPTHFVFEKSARDCELEGRLLSCDFDVVYYIDRDVTWVWYEELHFLWQSKSILTAGVTRESEFFVLTNLARDYGYAVKHETQIFDSTLVSWSLGPTNAS
tara:strand:- start:690 stop:1091 length:402 start_codon:yes stop_codon:yes gene_type:complete